MKEFEAFYVPIPANREEALRIVNIFKDVYEDPKILKVGQNLKYDLEVLRNYDIHLAGPMFDTMIAHYLIQPELHHNMDYMAEIYLNYQTIHIDELIGPKGKNQKSMRDLLPSQVYEYAAEDADVTLRLKNKLEPELKKFECEKLFYEIEMPLMPVLAEMEMNGVCLDTASLQETSKVLTDRMNELEARIYELAGEQFNIASPKQVGEILFDKLKIVVPEPGCLFFSADYSQIELRVMAHLSQDQNMIEVFREGKDLHAATAANIYKKDISEVTRDERTKSKRANFGIIYGITVFGLAERLDIPRDEAKMLIDGYFATFPQVHDYMEKSKEVARQKGYVTTLFGRRRYLPDINSHNATVRGFAERNAINAPIQGTAADIIKVAMIRIHERFQKEGIKSKMILQVHDELNFSVYPEEKEKVERIVIEEMQNAFPLNVPLVADSGFGQNWLEAH